MILVDANILIYATDPHSDRHEQARNWLDRQLSCETRVALLWESLLADMCIVTNPRTANGSVASGGRVARVRVCLGACGRSRAPGHSRRLACRSRRGSKLIPDAHLAALAIEHGLTLCSTDGDFARFPGLAWRNPLAHDQTE